MKPKVMNDSSTRNDMSKSITGNKVSVQESVLVESLVPLLINDRQRRLLNEITTAKANRNRKLAFRNHPLLRLNVPITEITTHQLKRSCSPLTSAELNLVKSTKLARRCTLRRGVGERDIELRNSGAT